MGRLIDADELKDFFFPVNSGMKEVISDLMDKHGLIYANDINEIVIMAFALDLLKGVQSVIDAEPTAYYPDRVVEQLKKEKEKGHYDSDSVIGEKNVWEKASDIVRKGGIDGKEEKQA